MALQPPTAQHLRRLAEAHCFELAEEELAAFQSLLPGIFTALDALDQAPSIFQRWPTTSAIRAGGQAARATRSMQLSGDAR